MNITFKKVTFSYHEDPLLKDVDFTFTSSDKLGLVGVNGVGKSTLLKLMLNLEKPQDGEILITGGAQINYLSQNVNIPSDRSCLEYIFSSLDKEKEIKEYEARSILTKFKIDPDGSTSFLSGGQKDTVVVKIFSGALTEFIQQIIYGKSFSFLSLYIQNDVAVGH